RRKFVSRAHSDSVGSLEASHSVIAVALSSSSMAGAVDSGSHRVETARPDALTGAIARRGGVRRLSPPSATHGSPNEGGCAVVSGAPLLRPELRSRRSRGPYGA